METWWPLLAGQRAAEPRENQAWVLGWFPQAGTLPARQSTQLHDKRAREQDILSSDSPAETGYD